MAIKVINYNGDIIEGLDTRNEFSSILGNQGYVSYGDISIDAQYPDRVNVIEGYTAFVGGLFVRNLADIQLEIQTGQYVVIETSYDGEEFSSEFKAVTEIDDTLVNGIKKHFPIFEKSSSRTGPLNNSNGIKEELEEIYNKLSSNAVKGWSKEVILQNNQWSPSGIFPYVQTINDSRIKASDRPLLYLSPNDTTSLSSRKANQEQYAKIKEIVAYDGSVQVRCYEGYPSLNMLVTILFGDYTGTGGV